MEYEFLVELTDTANKLIAMLCECEFETVEYVLEGINNNGYVFLEEVQRIEEEVLEQKDI